MLKINPNQEKKLKFALSPQGTFHGEIESYFRIYFDKINIGFPAEISNFEKVVFVLPKIIDYINFKLPEKARGALEIISDRDIFLAWQDEIKFKNIDIKAVLKKEHNNNHKDEVSNVILDNFTKAENILKQENNDNDFTINFINSLNKTKEILSQQVEQKKYELVNKTKEKNNLLKNENAKNILATLKKAKEAISDQLEIENKKSSSNEEIEEEEIDLKEINLCNIFKNMQINIDNDFAKHKSLEKINEIKKNNLANKLIDTFKIKKSLSFDD